MSSADETDPTTPEGALADPAAGTQRALTHRDRLVRFYPGLLGLTLLFAAIEIAFAIFLHEPALAAAAGSTCLFALGVLAASHRVRAGEAAQARFAIALTLSGFAAIGAYLIPGVGSALALLPVVSVVLVLPHVSRGRLVPLIAVAAGASVVILTLGGLNHLFPAISGPAGTIFESAILVSVVILVLLGVADFAMEAQDSSRELADSTVRHMQISAARLAIVAALRTMHAQPTPEATAELIAMALSDLPLVDFALVLEVTQGRLQVLAAAGHKVHPIRAADLVPRKRAKYLLERSRWGAWGELWANRPGPGLEDERMTHMGIKGQAFAPILAGDGIVGLISIATTDAQQAIHLVADLPSVSEAAAVAGAIVAPALLARQQVLTTRARIADAIAEKAFHAVFQPIIELATGRTVGFEALTRFTAGDRPDLMFAEAARVGLGQELEAAAIARAVDDARRLPAEAWLSLNVSPAFLAHCDELERLLLGRTRSIVLEITEHEAIDDYAPLHACITRLGPGVKLAVDDAGAGVANFQHLMELRPDLVKIDAGLVRGVDADVSRQALIVGFVHFAAVSGALVLAEGIETSAELETVQRLGVSLGQGYHLARPAPIDAWVETSAVLVIAGGEAAT